MAYVPVAAPVYASAEQLEQFASPQTTSRYADIPGLGRFAWYPLDTTARNGTTVIGTGAIGRWKLSDTFGNGSVWKQACFVAADSNVTLSGTQTIDGQSSANKTVLCTAQDAPAENGPWTANATGAWSRPLAKMLGQDIPLDTERGYNTTLPDPRIQLSRPVCPAERGFFVTPMKAGLRIGGAVEFAGLKAEPDFRRARAMLALCERMLPGLNAEGGREWMGFRPSMPDSMPVIGRATRHPNAIFAFGHGHLGLTLGATTGRLVADLARGRSDRAELSAFSPERF